MSEGNRRDNPPPRMPRPRRRLRNLLLDRGFQLKATVLIMLLAGLLSIGLGTFLYRAHRESSQVSLLQDPDLGPLLAEELAAEDNKVIGALAAFVVVLMCGVGVFGIVITHRVAGPAYVLRLMAGKVADGELPMPRPLRPGDQLQNVADEMARMLLSLRERERTDLEQLEGAVDAIDGDDAQRTGARQIIQEMVHDKRKRLGLPVSGEEKGA